jgi:hypothetical protein
MSTGYARAGLAESAAERGSPRLRGRHVDDHGVGRPVLDDVQGGRVVGGENDVEALQRERALERLACPQLVVDDEKATCHLSSGLSWRCDWACAISESGRPYPLGGDPRRGTWRERSPL